MNTTTAPRFPVPSDIPTAARTALKLLQRLRHGSITMQLPDGSMHVFGNHQHHGDAPTAAMTLRNWKVCSAALKSGDIGVAETYIDGDWTTPNLTDLLCKRLRT